MSRELTLQNAIEVAEREGDWIKASELCVELMNLQQKQSEQAPVIVPDNIEEAFEMNYDTPVPNSFRFNEVFGDIFDLLASGEFKTFCITTNGFVKSNGCAVMGAGIAKYCRDNFKGIDLALGQKIKNNGNVVQYVGQCNRNKHEWYAIAFPVKHHWSEMADIELIRKSCKELMALLDEHKWCEKILLPRPGCGNGKLKWSDVQVVLNEELDSRVYVAHNKK